MAGTSRKLLFVDTNIWLDFYRARSDAGLALLKNAEAVSDRMIVTYQLESEFKKNRQAALLEGMQELKTPAPIQRPGLLSDEKSTRMMNRGLKEAEKRAKELRAKLVRAIENPSRYDPVYKVCQRIFHKNDGLSLTRENKVRYTIRRKALIRFLHGCPPRKKTDTSFGDGFNWEWIVQCAKQHDAEVVIVSRDTDFGITIDNKAFINDHLQQEFSERVNRKSRLILQSRLSEALKLFEIPVSKKAEEAEEEVIEATTAGHTENTTGTTNDLRSALDAYRTLSPDYAAILKRVAQPREDYAAMLKSIAQPSEDYAAMLKSIAQPREDYAAMLKTLAQSSEESAAMLKSLATSRENSAAMLRSVVQSRDDHAAMLRAVSRQHDDARGAQTADDQGDDQKSTPPPPPAKSPGKK